MKFRPCIDIHNGKVKQIVGGSLKDEKNEATENFVSEKGAQDFAKLYQRYHLTGGHVILLNPASSSYYEETRRQAFAALRAFPQGLQVGGGVNPENALDFLHAGASHVIVTSFVFHEGRIDYDRLNWMEETVGRERLVLDVSCRKKGADYYVVTDRWQNFTEEKVTLALLEKLGEHCAEFLVHAVDKEGKARGIETELAGLLAGYTKRPVTYAGGIGSIQDLLVLKECTMGRLDFTIGSALDLFGGTIPFSMIAGADPDIL